MQSLLAGSADAVHMDLTTQLVDGEWIALLFDEVLDTRHATAPLRVAAVSLMKEMLKERDHATVGAVKTRLQVYPQWREYSGSEHTLFVPTTTVDDVRAEVLLLEDEGAGGSEEPRPHAQQHPEPESGPQSAAVSVEASVEADDDEDMDL